MKRLRALPLIAMFLTLSCSDYQDDLQAPGVGGQENVLTSNPFPEAMLNPNSKTFTEERMLLNIGVNVIYKNIRTLSLQAELLESQAVNYCADLDEGVDATQSEARFKEQWETTMLAYHTVAAAPVGPLTDNNLSDHIYSWPLISSCMIDEQVSDFADIGKAPADLLVNVKGLGALEYLLFEPTLVPKCSALLNKKAVDWGKKPIEQKKKDRCQYARFLAADVAKTIRRVDDLWNPEKANFTKTMVDGTRYRSIKAAVNALTDAMGQIEALKDDKLAKPMGLHEDCKSDEKRCPEMAEHRWSGIALQAINAQLKGFRSVFFGGLNISDKAHGFDDFLAREGHPEITSQMQAALADGIAKASQFSQEKTLQLFISEFDSVPCYNSIHGGTIPDGILPPLCIFYKDIRTANLLLRDDVLLILELTAPAGFQGDTD